MRHMDKFAITVAIAGLLMVAGNSTAAQAAEAAAPAATAQTAAPNLFDSLDANKDHLLSRQEFQSGYAGLQRLIAVQVRLREQFGALDANRNGAIDASEYANLELIRRQGAAAPSLVAFDIDHDQKLSFPEYATLVHQLAAGQARGKK